MKIAQYFIVFIALIIILAAGCIKSTVIGDDILKNDEIDVEYIDTLPLIAKTLPNDSLRVYPVSEKAFLLGQLKNPYIGKAKADLFLDFYTLGNVPDSNNFVFDSIILTVAIDTNFFYGNRFEKHHLDIYELDENIKKPDLDTIYADRTFAYKSPKIGEIDFEPLRIDSVSVIEPGNDTVKYTGQLRIRLDDQLGQRFLSDLDLLKDDTLFKGMFKGIYLKSTLDNNSMTAVSYLDSRGQIATKIEVFYTTDSTLHKSIFPLHHAVSHFEHNYEGSEMESAFDNAEKGDSFLYIQGMIGSKLEIEIPDLSSLKGKNINKAALVLYTVEDQNVIDDFPSRLTTYVVDSLGNMDYVKDLEFSIFNDDPNVYFGFGTETEENGIKTTQYNINLTLFIKELLKENTFNTKLIVVPDDRIQNPGFAKFYGVKNSVLRSKLKIIYSKTN